MRKTNFNVVMKGNGMVDGSIVFLWLVGGLIMNLIY